MIIANSILALSAIILAYTIKIGRKQLHQLALNSVGLLDVMLAKVDEDTHIEQVQAGTTKLTLSLFKTIGLFVLAIVLGLVPIAMLYLFSPALLQEIKLDSVIGIIAVSIGATVPFLIPSKKSSSSYSELSQLLHHLILDHYEIAKKLFAIDYKRNAVERDRHPEKFVIISGLARAGTTSIMNKLAKIDGFATLNYSNMPMVMAPNIWSKFYNPKNSKETERSHKDGIKIGLNSNEALEEYFFKAITNDEFIHDNALSPNHLSERQYASYLDYQSIIRKKPSDVYLAKNNNFILRYDTVRSKNSEFVMVIMFRDPIAHASSLLEKHLSFSEMQKEDSFVLDYMNWLGHHEFGLNHKPFDFGTQSLLENLDPKDISYWLQVWINYYEHASQISHENTLFINYEHYCEAPNEAIRKILTKAEMQVELAETKPFRNARTNEASADKSISARALEIYQQLSNKANRL